MRVKTGVHGFDPLVEGGLLRDRLYLLSGPPGSGKTTFSAHFLAEGAREGEKCLYLSMHETEAELVQDMARFDFGFTEAVESKRLKFLNLLSERSQGLLVPRNTGGDYRSDVQQMTDRLSGFVAKHDVDRLVIDSTMLLRYYYSNDDKTFIQFLTGLKNTGATTLLISEMTDPTAYADEHFLAHGVIFFHNYLEPDGMRRGIQIIKMRGTDIDADIRKVEFTPEGFRVDAGTLVEA
jgi:KaiC/GvpD/RAD55 family RecA-like ATPase